MREIVFRGKRKDNGKWIEGYYFKKLNPHTEDGFPLCHGIADLPPFGAEVIPETVGQFTGLVDRNSKRIFEGDIILFEDESPSNYEYHDCTEMRCGEMKFGDGQFYLTNRIAVEMDDLIYDEKLDGVIVGNIHDNPELLERSNENAE